MGRSRWWFKENTLYERIYKDRNEAGAAITDLILDLINNDVLMARIVPRQYNLTLNFSFDYDNIVTEQVTAWYKDDDSLESYLQRLKNKEGEHWRQRNRGLGGYSGN